MASKKTTKAAKTRATATGTVRFGKERSDLTALVQEAATNLQTDLVAADAASRSAAHYARASRPAIKHIYDTAAGSLAGTRQDVANAGGPVTAIGRGVLAREQAGAQNRLAAARARSEQDIEDRIGGAISGKTYAQTAARDKYRTTISDLSSKLRDIDDRQGAFVVSEMGNILEKNAGRRAASRNIRLTSSLGESKVITSGAFAGRTQAEVKAMDPKQRTTIAKQYEKSGGKGKKKNAATNEDRQQFETAFATAKQYAQVLSTGKKPDGSAVRDKKTNKRIGALGRGQTGQQLISKINNQAALSAALDMVYDGHISRETARRLHEQGINVADIPGAKSSSQFGREVLGGRYAGRKR